MSDEKKEFDLNGLIDSDRKQKLKKKRGREVVTLREYLDIVREDPRVSQISALRLKELFDDWGFEDAPDDYHLFGVTKVSRLVRDKWKLFGPQVQRAAMEFYDWLGSGPPTEQMAAVFVGPTASGKSTFVAGLMRELESYNLRKVYGIKGCPMREDPLNALPRYMRRRTFDAEKAAKVGLDEPIEEKLGIADIEGDLCPPCRRRFLGWKDGNKNWHEGEYVDEDGVFNWSKIEAESFTFSVQGGRGIGSFEPSGEKAQDETDLTAKKRMAVIENPSKGDQHPEAFSFSGELPKGNRGITEAREIFKTGIDDKILWIFINVTAEKQLKVQGSTMPHVYIDTVTVGHCNLNGFKSFAGDRGQEGMHSRFYVIPFPYALRVKDEVEIYKKLINQKSDFGEINRAHIAPGALELTALAVVMSRYVESNRGITPLTKAKAYNGESVLADVQDKEKNPVTVEDLIEEGEASRDQDLAKVEGMSGIDPRDALSALNVALAKESGNNGCLTPLKAISALRDLFRNRMGHSPEDVESFLELLSAEEEGASVISEYYDFVKKTVGRAFLKAYDDQARSMFDRYMEEVAYYMAFKNPTIAGRKSNTRKKDPVTGKVKQPDEKLMRSIEEHFDPPVDKSEKDVHRTEVLSHKTINSDFGYDNYEPLRNAVEEKLLEDASPLLRAILSSDIPKNSEARERSKDLFKTMLEKGCCEVCAQEFVEQAAPLFD